MKLAKFVSRRLDAVQTKLSLLNKLCESMAEKLDKLLSEEIETEIWKEQAFFETMSRKWNTIPSSIEHKCSAMPFGHVIKKHEAEVRCGYNEPWWRLHFPDGYETDLAPHVFFCPYCGKKLS